MERTEEWGDKPWLEPGPDDEPAAKHLEALLPVLAKLQDTEGASTLHTLRPEHAPQASSAGATGIAVSDEVLGRGGMSVVLLGEQRSLGRSVAVKTVGEPKESDDESPEQYTTRISDMLLREAQITGTLEHPNVLPLYDLCVNEGQPQLVLKRIEGRPWTEFIHHPNLVEEQPGSADAERWHLQVFLQVCNAIRFAHARGVIHRDLKPDNVMIGSFGEVYVLDWGIAVRRGEERSGSLAGTPAYMAPEMAAGETLDERTDVYLLGSVLYELFHAAPPHAGSNFAKVMWSALTSRPAIDDETPPGFAQVIRRAMQRQPEDRYRTVEELQGAATDALERLDADAMCALASKKLAELETLLAGDTIELSAATVHELYGQTRFAFQTALDRFGDLEDAQDGSQRLQIAMAKYALALGETAAAEGHLANVNPPPAELVAAIEARRNRDATATDRLNALEAFRSDLDKNKSRRRRFQFTVLVGIVWTLQGVGLELGGGVDQLTYTAGLVAPAINSVLFFALLKLRKSWNRYDRRFLAASSLGFFAEFALDVTLFVAGTTPAQALVHDLIIRAFMVGVVAIYVERALMIPAMLLGLGGLVSSLYPQYVLWWVTGTSLVTMSVLAWRWRPTGAPLESHDQD